MKILLYIFTIFACIKNIHCSDFEMETEKSHKSFTITKTLPNVLWKHIVYKLDGESAKKFMLVSKLAYSFVKNRKSIKFKSDVPADIFDQIIKITPLEYIDISNCQNIFSENLYASSLLCPDLKYLNISQCNSITSPAIFKISHNWPNLETIEMDYCHDITSVDLRNYLKKSYLPERTINIFHHAFKKRKINLGRAMNNLYMYITD